MKKWSLFLVMIFGISAVVYAQKNPEVLNFDWGKPVFETGNFGDRDTTAVFVLKSNTVIEYMYDGNEAFNKYLFVYEKVKINNEEGLERYNKFIFRGEIVVLKVRFIGKDGKVIELDKSNLKTVNREDGSYQLLTIEGAEVGGIVEYYFVKKSPLNVSGRLMIQSEFSQQDVSVSIISPINLQFITKSYNGCPEMTEAVDSVKQIRIRSLHMDEVPPLRRELFSFFARHLQQVEYCFGYNSNNSTSVANLVAQAIQDEYDRTSSFTKKEIDVLKPVWKKMGVEKSMKEEQKIRKIENYIKMRFELDDDYVRLLSASFQHFGIPFELVLTCNKEERKFDKDFEGLNFLDDNLFYFPSIDSYVDPNNKYSRLGLIGSEYIGNYGLFLKRVEISGFSTFVPYTKWIPEGDYTQTTFNTKAQMKLNLKKFSAEYSIQHTMTGYSSAEIQPVHNAAKDVKKRVVEALMITNLPPDRLTGWKIKTVEPIDWPVKPLIVTAEFSGNSLITEKGNNILVRIGELIGRQQEIPRGEERKLPMESSYPRIYEREITFEIPKGYTVSNLDDLKIKKELMINGIPDAYFYSDYSISGNKLIITATEVYKSSVYPVSVYKSFVEVINAAADFNKLSIILTPIGK